MKLLKPKDIHSFHFSYPSHYYITITHIYNLSPVIQKSKTTTIAKAISRFFWGLTQRTYLVRTWPEPTIGRYTMLTKHFSPFTIEHRIIQLCFSANNWFFPYSPAHSMSLLSNPNWNLHNFTFFLSKWLPSTFYNCSNSISSTFFSRHSKFIL